MRWQFCCLIQRPCNKRKTGLITKFDVHVTVDRHKFLIKKNQLDALISHIYSWNETLHVSDSSSVHHQEFFTVHAAMVYVIQVCWQLANRSKCSCSQSVGKPVWLTPWLCVQWKSPDDGQRNCPKHIDFHSENKFEKLMPLVGFIIGKLYSSFQQTLPSPVGAQKIG